MPSEDVRTYWDAKLEQIFGLLKDIKESEASCKAHFETVLVDVYARLNEKKTKLAVLETKVGDHFATLKNKEAVGPHRQIAVATWLMVLVGLIGAVHLVVMIKYLGAH